MLGTGCCGPGCFLIQTQVDGVHLPFCKWPLSWLLHVSWSGDSLAVLEALGGYTETLHWSLCMTEKCRFPRGRVGGRTGTGCPSCRDPAAGLALVSWTWLDGTFWLMMAAVTTWLKGLKGLVGWCSIQGGQGTWTRDEECPAESGRAGRGEEAACSP